MFLNFSCIILYLHNLNQGDFNFGIFYFTILSQSVIIFTSPIIHQSSHQNHDIGSGYKIDTLLG